MARTGIRQRSWLLVAATLLALLIVLSCPGPTVAAAANPGAPAPSGSGGSGSQTSPRGPRQVGPARAGRLPHRAAPPLIDASSSLSDARCVPAADCTSNPHEVSLHGYLVLRGSGLDRGLIVAFPRSRNATIASGSPLTRIYQSPYGPLSRCPSGRTRAASRSCIGGGRRSNAAGPITVVPYALHPPKPKVPAGPDPSPGQVPVEQPSKARACGSGTSASPTAATSPAIVAQAHAAGVSTLFVKSSDGSSNYWSQFCPELVQQLHANGLKVCAWQYVYGTNPAGRPNSGRARWRREPTAW